MHLSTLYTNACNKKTKPLWNPTSTPCKLNDTPHGILEKVAETHRLISRLSFLVGAGRALGLGGCWVWGLRFRVEGLGLLGFEGLAA